MVSTLERCDSDKKLEQVECTECGELTWNTYSKLCDRCYRYRHDIK